MLKPCFLKHINHLFHQVGSVWDNIATTILYGYFEENNIKIMGICKAVCRNQLVHNTAAITSILVEDGTVMEI